VAPRSYSMFVLFTADSSLCRPCGVVRAQLEKVVKEYYRVPERQRSSKPVYFAELKISPSDQEFLQQYDIKHVPLLYYFASGKSQRFPSGLRMSSPDNFNIEESGFGPNQLKEFVNSRSGSRMNVVRGGYQIPFVQPVRAFMPIILGSVFFFASVAVTTGLYKKPMTWYALVVLVYIFSVGGGHFSWITNAPLVVVNRDGAYEFIAGGSRSQYVAEGFFVSATCVGISVLAILIQELPKVLPQKGAQTIVGLGMVAMMITFIVALLILYHFVSYRLPDVSYFTNYRRLFRPTGKCACVGSNFHRLRSSSTLVNALYLTTENAQIPCV